jgi:hypothetical protein
MGRRNLNNEVLGFADAAADPAADGNLQRNGDALKWYDSGGNVRKLFDSGNHHGVLWVPVHGMYAGTCAQSSLGDFHGYRIDTAGQYFKFNFAVPSNFDSIVKAVLVYGAVGNQAGTNGLDIDTDYAAAGEAYDTHAAGAIAGADSGPVTDKLIYEVDISAALADIAADDYVGVKVTVAAGDSPGNRVVLGFRFEWKEAN